MSLLDLLGDCLRISLTMVVFVLVPLFFILSLSATMRIRDLPMTDGPYKDMVHAYSKDLTKFFLQALWVEFVFYFTCVALLSWKRGTANWEKFLVVKFPVPSQTE